MARPAPKVVTAPLALDPMSAALAKQVGFEVVYVGGGGLGYQRAVSEALLTASEVGEAARAIAEQVDVGVVVDGTTGFGDAVHTWRTVRMMEQTGAVAVELEDQLAPKRAHHQKGIDHMIPAPEMAGKIAAAVDARTDSDFLIIARTNALSHDGVEDALARLAVYAEAGADLLLALPRDLEELESISSGTELPLVAMLPAGRSDADLLGQGYALKLDAFSATLHGYRAIRRGYEDLLAGEEMVDSIPAALAELAPLGKAMQIELLREIEARTTERATPVGDGAE
ncbi:MAG: isocitrate lyase/phosphoenolpyruvate mutase family protein [Solirubrobacterales bacterium]